MKSVIITALAITFGFMFFFYRRRLKLAIMVAGILFASLTAVRLFVMREEVDRFAELGLGLAALGAVWVLTNLVTALLQRRRQRRLRR